MKWISSTRLRIDALNTSHKNVVMGLVGALALLIVAGIIDDFASETPIGQTAGLVSAVPDAPPKKPSLIDEDFDLAGASGPHSRRAERAARRRAPSAYEQRLDQEAPHPGRSRERKLSVAVSVEGAISPTCSPSDFATNGPAP